MWPHEINLSSRVSTLPLYQEYNHGFQTYFLPLLTFSYDKQSGRESILEQLDSIFTKFPVVSVL